VTPSPPRRPALERWFGNPLLLAAAAVAIFLAVTVASILRTPATTAPPVLGTLPPFELTDQQGQPFGTTELSGHVWIANFIFTRCPTVCPLFTQRMAGIQKRTRQLGMHLRLVSFSVDPDYDTPEVLEAYAERFAANPYKWKFLTGDYERIRVTVRDGLKVAMQRAGQTGDVPDIIHGTHFVLLDQRGRIRGYYASDDPEEVDRMVRQAALLINHPPRPAP